MAYHNLNEKNIPLTSYPDVPIASPLPNPAYYPQPPIVAQPIAQLPQYTQGQPPQMYQPAFPQGQPVYAQAPPQQAYSPNYVPSYQPVYVPPSSIAQPAPVPLNYVDLKAAIRARHSHFSCGRYIKQAHHFSKNNWCKLIAAFLLWSLVGWGVNTAVNHLSGRNRHHSDWDGEGDVVYACDQQRQQDERACGGMGCFKTKCALDGSFAPQQTLGSSCWCVDKSGNKYEDTVQACSLFSHDCAVRRTQTDCQARRAAELALCTVPTCYASQCESDGSFTPQQRHGLIKACWCVDTAGVEINGTRGPCTEENVCSRHEYWAPMIMPAINRSDMKQLVLWGFLHLLASIVLWNPVIAGLYTAVFNAIKNNSSICLRDLFSGFKCCYYCKLLRLSFVLRILEGILFLLVLPGIWWALATMFAIPAHKEHSFLGVCGSLRISMVVVHRHFCSFIGFLLLLALLQIVGFLCLIVGLLYTMPLAFVALCYCYHDLVGIVGDVPFAGPVDVPVAVHV